MKTAHIKSCSKSEFYILSHEDSKGYMSCIMRKPAFCICKKKDADQLCRNCAADQHLCFRYTDSAIPLLSKSETSSLKSSSVAVQPVCFGAGRKPQRQVFTQWGSYFFSINRYAGVV